MKGRIRLATAWLSGCSGCHMGLLNLHAGLLELLERCDLVYSPLADAKEYPHGVDICLVEGAVGNADNRELAAAIRERTTFVASLGDCAVNGNVTALRNPRGAGGTLDSVYPTSAFTRDVPVLEKVVLPLHQVIEVDAFIPGCPPAPGAIEEAIGRLIARM
ncbi:MAG TPA: hypothetical protein VF795_10915 [Desulfuromonadaceae bacterium]